MNKNGNFCKGTYVSKFIAETKVDARVEQQKKFTGFSHMFAIAKNIELFTSTLNGITASIKCVSSIIVVLKPKLTDMLRPMRNEEIQQK